MTTLSLLDNLLRFTCDVKSPWNLELRTRFERAKLKMPFRLRIYLYFYSYTTWYYESREGSSDFRFPTSNFHPGFRDAFSKHLIWNKPCLRFDKAIDKKSKAPWSELMDELNKCKKKHSILKFRCFKQFGHCNRFTFLLRIFFIFHDFLCVDILDRSRLHWFV